MNILSFMYGPGCHDTAAAIMCDGQLVAAAEEERFSRTKHERRFPSQAIAYCLKEAGLRMSQIDVLAFPEQPYRVGPDSYYREMEWNLLNGRNEYLWKTLSLIASGLHLRTRFYMESHVAEGFRLLREHFEGEPKSFRFYDHHRCHAAAAYYTSGLAQSAIVTMDFNGGPYSTGWWRAQGNSLTRLRVERSPNSLGIFYWDCTRYLGLGRTGEGKAMGLAAYGNPDTFGTTVANILEVNSSDYYHRRRRPDPSIVGFPPRKQENIMSSPYPDFAAAFQTQLERGIQRVVALAFDKAGTRALCIGGGVGLNCSSNGALLRVGMPSSLWLFPASNDAGLPVGSALLAAVEAGEWRSKTIDHAYWGPSFSSAACEAAIQKESRVRYSRLCTPADIARRLAQGQIIGWFQGRMEIGPRALCHRSILADPRSTVIRDRVNRLKGREPWRPLAPVIVAERAGEYFELDSPSPFMLVACAARPEVRKKICGVVHVDGSARPQTVTREQNGAVYDLLLDFERCAGVAILLNTSFNMAGEPIVCTPDDAIRTFLRAGLDCLVLEDFLVERIDAQPVIS